MMLPALACGAGYLGLYFNLLALLPFSALGAGAYLLSAWSSGQSLFDSAWNLSLAIISIQAGYMLGLTARDPYRQILERIGSVQSHKHLW
jgi:steroid 5-alpha reductase family enzyme